MERKKKTSDPASGRAQGEDREWKYLRMSVVGELARRFSGVQSNSQEQEICSQFKKLSEKGEPPCSEPSVVCLRDTEDGQKRREL